MSVYEKMTAIADAIRGKTMEEEKLSLDAMARQIGELSPFIVPEVTGETIALTDSSNRKFRGLTLYGKTTQDGTPTPDAPVALVSAGDGGSVGVSVARNNLYDINTYPLTQGQWITPSGGEAESSSFAATLDYIPVNHLAGNVITLNKRPGGDNQGVCFYDANKNVLAHQKNANGTAGTPMVINVHEDAVYMRFTTVANDYEIQIELGSTTEYEPYKTPQILPVSTPNGLAGIPVTSGGNYTDSNGQQRICDEVDLARGVRVPRVIKTVFDGDENWKDRTSEFTNKQEGQYRYSLNNPIPGGYEKMDTDSVSSVRGLSNWGNVCGLHGVSNKSEDGLAFYTAGQNAYTLYLTTSKYTSVEELKAGLSDNPLTILSIALEPIETPLSAEELAAYAALHTNYPNTTIFSDAGVGMKVAYVADTENFVAQHANTVAVSVLEAAYQEGVDSI